MRRQPICEVDQARLRVFVPSWLTPPARNAKTSSTDPSQNRTCSADDRWESCSVRSSRPCNSAGLPSSCTKAALPSTDRPDCPPPETPPPVPPSDCARSALRWSENQFHKNTDAESAGTTPADEFLSHPPREWPASSIASSCRAPPNPRQSRSADPPPHPE